MPSRKTSLSFPRCRKALITLILLSGAFASINAAAQTFPARPIRMIIPFPPGGGNDIMGRFLAQKMSERMGQPTVVDNRAGADGIIGTDTVARSAPDGYTILIVSSSYTTNAAIHKLPYDPVKSLTPISQIGAGHIVVFAAPGLAANNAQELIAMTRTKPGGVRYASSGVGGLPHFNAELFNTMAGVKMIHVPYKGGAPSMQDVMTGLVEVGFGTLTQVLPLVRSGKLKVLGVGSPRRAAAMPDIPTIAESGIPGFDSTIWWGVLGPAGLPPAILSRLNAEIGASMKDPDMVKRLAAEAAEPVVAPPEAFARLIAVELERWARVARETGIKAE